MPRVLLLFFLLVLAGDVEAPSGGLQEQETSPREIPPLVLPPEREATPVPGGPSEPDSSLPVWLELSLSEGTSGAQAPAVGTATPLPADRVEALLARLPEAPGGPSAYVVPAVDPGSTPERTESPARGPLRIVSVLPAGETDLAPYVTVVFSKPMVPLGRDGEPLAGQPPARLDPEPPGTWRWLDVRTLRFEPEAGRLAGARSYTVRVPGGTRSVDGTRLGAPHEAAFMTAGPRAMAGYPHAVGRAEPARLDPVIFLTFDQDVEPAAVVAAARLSVGDRAWAVRVVAASELEEHDARLMDVARRSGAARWAALRPLEPLPPGTEAVLRLGGGLTSLEGPRTTGRVQELRFRTRGPFEVSAPLCQRPDEPCRPGEVLQVDFTNPLAPNQPLAELITLDPRVEGLRVRGDGNRVWFLGDFRPQTAYDIRISPELQDRFGQRIEGPQELRFHFGAPRPYVAIPGGPFVVMDPAAGHRLDVATRGVAEVDVAVYPVRPEDWFAFQVDWERRRYGIFPLWVPQGPPVARWTVSSPGDGVGFAPISLDLSSVFRKAGGHAVVMVEARREGEEARVTRRGARESSDMAWVQSTSFAVGAVWDPVELVGWAVALDDGRPLKGVELSLPRAGSSAVTDEQGLARLALGTTADSLLVARYGGEVALLPEQVAERYGRGWMRDPAFPAPVWFALTDRGLYRPGEELEGHGWIRALEGAPWRDLTYPRQVDSVRYEVRSSRNQVVSEGAVPVSGAGTFHLVMTLPGDMRSGFATLEFTAISGGEAMEDWSEQTYFQVEDFRRPAYEVTGEMGPGPYLAGDVLEASARAAYYDGAGLPGSPVSWRASSQAAWWNPPGWERWHFGGAWSGGGEAVEGSWTLEGETDAEGRHVLRLATGTLALPVPVVVDVEAEVMDMDRQTGSVQLGTVVYPGRLAVGIRANRYWVRAGEEATFEVAATDLEGNPMAGSVPAVRAFLEPDLDRPGSADSDEAVPVSCAPGAMTEVGGEAVRPFRCVMVPRLPGRYRVEAEVRDEEGRLSQTTFRTWALSSTSPWVGGARGDDLTLSPDRELYQPGDTARIMVTAPYYPVEGLLTVARHGIQRVRALRIEGAGYEITLPIHEEDAGGLRVRVDIASTVGGREGLTESTVLPVELEARRLQVSLEPDRGVVAPGDSVAVEVAVTDANGAPAAGGVVALWLVDEAVLALGGYRLASPLETLHELGYDDRSDLFLPHHAVRWIRKALGPGFVTAELLDGSTGTPIRALRVTLDGEDRGLVQGGALLLRNVGAGPHRLVLFRGEEPVLERAIDVPAGGLDLGTVLLGEAAQDLARLRTSVSFSVSVDEMMVTAMAMGSSVMVVPAGETSSTPVSVRRQFRPLAAFEPAVALDDEGRARVTVRLPDTMTRYRIMAVASHGPTRFGAAVGQVSATRELVVRASPPRFLHPGDRAELPVTVQNTSSRTVDAEVAARTPGLALEGNRGFLVRLPPGGRTEVRFPARAGSIGAAGLEVVAVAGVPGREMTDAVGVTIPVRPALAPRAVALHERVVPARPLRLELETPARAVRGFGGVDVGVSTTLLQPLVEVLRSLCLEPLHWPGPTVARVLGLAALDDALESLTAPDLPEPPDLRSATEADVERLMAWLRPYLYGYGTTGPQRGFLHSFEVVHAAHAVHVAAGAGYEDAQGMDRAIVRLVRDIWTRELATFQSADLVKPRSRWGYATAAYALHLGYRLDPAQFGPEAAKWIPSLDPADLPVEVLAWLLAPASAVGDSTTVRARLLQELENRALTTGATVTFRQGGVATVSSSEAELDRLVLASDRRSDAVALSVLVDEEPGHRFIPGLVRGLLGQRDGTALGGAHENGWVMLALGRYATLNEAVPADLRVRVRLGGEPLGEEVHLDRATRTAVVVGPLGAPGRSTTLDLTSEGQGTLYVRAGVRYAPLVTLDMPAEERGFLVSRRYEAVDDSADVRLEANGTWRIRAGARVRVRVTITAPGRRYRVQMRDPIPAGLESVNPRLLGVGFTDDPLPAEVDVVPWSQVEYGVGATFFNYPYGWDLTDLLFRWRAWRGNWATHEEFRDDRFEAYTPYLPAGTYQSTYLTRATTPGTFLAPPPRVDETEHPETFGQGSPDRVIVAAGGG